MTGSTNLLRGPMTSATPTAGQPCVDRPTPDGSAPTQRRRAHRRPLLSLSLVLLTFGGWQHAATASPAPPAENPPSDGDSKPSPALAAPTGDPTNAPANAPANDPTNAPTSDPKNAPTSDPKGDPNNAPTNAPTNDPRARAEQIVALMRGELDLEVDAAELFRVDLSESQLAGGNGEPLLGLLRALEAPPPKRRRRGSPPPIELDKLEPAVALETAMIAFFRLPQQERQELLRAHAERRSAAKAKAEATQRDAARLAQLRARSEQLKAFLSGELDLAIDPRSLLQLDLLEPTEMGLSAERRASWIAPAVPAEPGPSEGAAAKTGDPPQDVDAAKAESLRADLVAVEAELDAQRRRYLQLSADERAQLLATQRRRIEAAAQAKADAAAKAEAEAKGAEKASAEAEALKIATAEENALLAELEEVAQDISNAEGEAESAAAARLLALDAAKRAKTEAKRLLAEETARLLGVKEAQARYEAELKRRTSERHDNHEKALEWNRKVSELNSSPMFASEKAVQADPLYNDLRTDLRMMRGRLRDQLERLKKSDVPTVGEALDRELPQDVERRAVDELRDELLANEQSLLALENQVSWELAQGLRDDVVVLNRARLTLLEIATPGLRVAVTGFGRAGVDQVERELDQISLELRFNALRLRSYRSEIYTKLRGATIPLLIGAIQLVLVFLAFAWWRRRSPQLLTRLHAALLESGRTSQLSSFAATFVWYAQRVRRPLELLLVLTVLARLISVVDLPELNLVWIVALWILTGLAVILFVDALAERDNQYSVVIRDTSGLRIHSLRVVGILVIAVGLALSLTSAIVGQGAIYSWVLSTCWLLSLPVALYLIYRWRPIIFEIMAQRPEQGPFVHWVTANQGGLGSFPAAAAASVYLLGAGLASWIMRQLSGLEATRRLLAYMFRREVAKQAAATMAAEHYSPVDPQIYARFDPSAPASVQIAEVTEHELEQVVSLAAKPKATLSVVVGERGLGKSLFLNNVAKAITDHPVHVLQCPEEGIDALIGLIAGLTPDPSLRGPALYQVLRELGQVVIVIDDIQRLVVPAVNGLIGLDRFTAFSRDVGGEVSWIVSIGSAAWHYVRRARGERVFFEQVIVLPRWTEDELGKLIRATCELAEIAPSFEGLVVPRQASAPLPDQGDRTEAGYYRLLWDYSDGNPAVALHAFRESLFTSTEGQLVVRLFKEPSPTEIEDLSLTILFVLRSIVVLEYATVAELKAATELPRADVEDAIRFGVSRGYLDPLGLGVRISLPWYRTITRVLQRQHLLSTL